MSFSSSLQILKHKEFRYFVFARFFLTLAIQMQMSTINLQIYYEYAEKNEVAIKGNASVSPINPNTISSLLYS